MGAKLNKVFVVDVESTCWETREEQGKKPNEVIEIGVCVLNIASGNVSIPQSFVIKPRYTEVSPFCTKLTGWTQDDVKDGYFAQQAVMAIEREYSMTKDNVWFSCGEYDRVKLGSHGPASLGELYKFHAEDNIFAKMRHVNIKTLFALKHKLSKEMGMDRMLQHMGETLEGRHHNGADDAFNIAKIVRHVLS
jgi:inhibitor of KinA sporulation pathway (predicted exonuclease)